MVNRDKREYRRNVAIVVVNHAGLVLACHRSDSTGIWQIPQGGIEEGESDEEAMHRELEEEIGTSDVDILGKLAHASVKPRSVTF